jgi:DNA topoisomerase-2
LKWTVKFIKDVNSDKIIIRKNTKAKIIERLEELEYPKLCGKINNKNANSKQLDEDSDDESEKKSNKSYDYLTKLPLFSLTQDRINELEKELKENQDELDYLNKSSADELWETELKELLKEYNEWYAEWHEDNKLLRKTKKDSAEDVKKFVGRIKDPTVKTKRIITKSKRSKSLKTKKAKPATKANSRIQKTKRKSKTH